MIYDSAKWTGRQTIPNDGRGAIIRWSFKSPTQLSLFMVWREWWWDYDVYHAVVLFSTYDLRSKDWWALRLQRCKWRWQDRLRQLIRMVSGHDNSSCSVCRGSVDFYPGNPFRPSWCYEHCPEHDYAYDRDIHMRACIHCGSPEPYD
jgi:hypothetical protein